MKSRPLPYLMLFFITWIGLLSSCDDIIEPSINKTLVTLEAPANQYTSASYTINFWWDPVDHALSYHLQVVTPNFAAPGSLALDTIITANKFTFNLNPGVYQWRVMAENGSTQTAYATPKTFTVAATSITMQAVQLSSPGNNSFTNQPNGVFQWGSLYGASQYLFQIDTNNFVNPNSVVSSTTVPGQQINFTFPKSQVYQWRVQAQNDTAQAKWSPVYTVTFNNVPPAQVALVSPASGTTQAQPITLQWSPVTNASHYKLYALKSDSTTLYNNNFPLVVNGTSYSFSQGTSGDKIYWKVSAVDAENNEGMASPLANFMVQ